MAEMKGLTTEEYAVLREYITNSEGVPSCRTVLTRDVWTVKFRKHIHDVVLYDFLYNTKFPNGIAPAGRRTSHLHGGVLKEADVSIMNRTIDGPHYRVDLPIEVTCHSQPLGYLHWACATIMALSFWAVHLTMGIKIDLSQMKRLCQRSRSISGKSRLNEASECPPRGFFDRLIYLVPEGRWRLYTLQDEKRKEYYTFTECDNGDILCIKIREGVTCDAIEASQSNHRLLTGSDVSPRLFPRMMIILSPSSMSMFSIFLTGLLRQEAGLFFEAAEYYLGKDNLLPLGMLGKALEHPCKGRLGRNRTKRGVSRRN
ncbi:hypothetical protein EDD85DRAFT_247270 [Armillaria nabsnona]|nr:hypothetical protein EDD85DRAFT_247270 [Armillaria nabsnona]